MNRQKPQVVAPVLTPVDRAFEPDPVRLTMHIESLLRDGCHGIALFGTTGEASSLSVPQRKTCLDRILERGIDARSLFVGVGCVALADTVELGRHAAERGCRKLLVLPPFYYKDITDEDLILWYSEVVHQIGFDDICLYLYHFPSMTGVQITDRIIDGLLTIFPQNIVGIKDSSGDISNTEKWILHYPELQIFPGSERNLLRLLEIGAAGVISAVANINASPMRRLVEEFSKKEINHEDLQNHITQVREIFEMVSMIPGLKYVIAQRYKDNAWNRCIPPKSSLPVKLTRSWVAQLQAYSPKILRPSIG